MTIIVTILYIYSLKIVKFLGSSLKQGNRIDQSIGSAHRCGSPHLVPQAAALLDYVGAAAGAWSQV